MFIKKGNIVLIKNVGIDDFQCRHFSFFYVDNALNLINFVYDHYKTALRFTCNFI